MLPSTGKRKEDVYLGHRKILKCYHPYRRLRKAFNGEQEHGVAPKPLSGEEVYQRQLGLDVVFGKYQKRSTVKNVKEIDFLRSSILV